MTPILLAIIFGLLFGFILQKSGASNPEKILNMLRLKDSHLIKVILFGIGISSLLLFVLGTLGIIDANFSVKTAYIGVGVGGLIFGLGWAISGFCPGTSVVALGERRKDAFAFVLGGLLGAFVYMLVYGDLKSTFLFQKILGGKVTLVDTGVSKYTYLLENLSASYVATVIAIIFIIIAFILPNTKKD